MTGGPAEPERAESDPRSAEQRRVLVVDDEEVILRSCRRILEKAGYTVETFDRGDQALKRLPELDPQILLVDLKMPELNGFQVIETVRRVNEDVVVVVITGQATIATAVDAMKAGAYDFLPKPFTSDELRLVISRSHERWRLATGLRRLEREKAEAQRRFVTFVSHQLKTPLSAVKQYVDVLMRTEKASMSSNAIDWLDRSTHRLNEMCALIDDWLTLAKVEEKGVSALRGTTDLAAILPALVEAERAIAHQAHVQLTLEMPQSLPPVVGDSMAVSMVVSNLIGNAIKYNRRGGRVIVCATGEENGTTITVQDTGIGIPSDCLPQLFQEFYRVRTTETRDIPGTGLGLAICKRIITELKGRIAVTSKVGEGTTVTAFLPKS